MTLDGIWSRLCDREILRGGVGGKKETLKSLQAVSQVGNEDGTLNVKASDTGESLRLKTRGKSKARALADGTYEGWVINAYTNKREYITPKNKKGK